jgi:hypothetical protein
MLSSALPTQAEEYILRAKNLDWEEALALPGVYGSSAAILLNQESGTTIKKLPKAVSKHPLTSEFYLTRPDATKPNAPATVTARIGVFFDESKGTGQGYDRMVADLNRNGDLTDDPVFEKLSHQPKSLPKEYEYAAFGPMEMPSAMTIGPWRPRVFTELYLYNRSALTNKPSNKAEAQFVYVGSARMRPANCLVTAAELEGTRYVLGFLDANCNFRIGEQSGLRKYERTGADPYYYLDRSGDVMLVDRDGSGSIEGRAFIPEAEPLSSVVYLGGKPYSVKLADDVSKVELTPYTGALGKVTFQKTTTQLTLAREIGSNKWELVSPDLKGGTAKVPAGNYRVARYQAAAEANGEWVCVESTDMAAKTRVVSADSTLALEFGPPFKLNLTAENRQVDSRETAGLSGALSRMLGKREETATELRLGVTLTGAGGERYSSYLTSAKDQLPPPTFEIADAGKTVANGKFEYG